MTNERSKKSPFELREKDWNWWKSINHEIFKVYFGYQNPSFLANYLYKANEAKNEQMIKRVNNAFIDLWSNVIRKKIPENENLDKVISIIEKTLNFNKQQKGAGLKILTSKQILAQVKVGNTSENLLNETYQIIYFFLRKIN